MVQPYLKEDLTYFFQKHIINNVDFDFSSNELIEGLKVEHVNSIPVIQVVADHQQVLNNYLIKR